MQGQADEEELELSGASLAALKEFALENNLLEGPEVVGADLRLQVQERLDVKERDHDFLFTYGGGDDDIDEQVSVVLTGVNPELGQTLASTGLTVWRAGQELARFMWEHRRWFVGKSLVELGAGLGLCSVLASRLCAGGKVVVTDGGEEFTDSAMEALRRNLVKNSCDLGLPPRRHLALDDDAALQVKSKPACADPLAQAGARVVLERLTWGEHKGFLERHRKCSGGDNVNQLQGGFDFVVAADVLYEEEAVVPLLSTVVDILRLRYDAGALHRRRPLGGKGSQDHSDGQPDPRSSLPSRVQGEDGEVVNFVGEAATARTSEDGSAGDFGVSPPRPQHKPSCPTAGFPWSPSVPTFLLAFARRNVSIDRVLQEADNLGLRWVVPKDFAPSSALENVYLMSLDDVGKCL